MKLGIVSLYLLSTVIVCNCATAQISSDGTLSTTVITNDAINFLIENGDRTGDNLFHSFREFSIPNLGEAYFNNNPDITNIFSRVTGGNISDLQGSIRANGTANLFLINPAGIIFGENASLNIGGSFFATTADTIVFPNDIEFSATDTQEPPLLSINIPLGIQFGSTPQPVVVQSQVLDPVAESTVGLQVPSGQTIALVGGNLEFPGGGITASTGRIELGSVASNSFVNITPLESGWTLDYQGVREFQDINLTDSAFINTSGNSGGNIKIQARRVNVTQGSGIFANTFGDESGGILRIRATESIEVSNSQENLERVDNTSITNPLFSQLSTRVFGSAQGSELIVETPNFTLAGLAFVSASTIGEGDAGDVRFQVEHLRVLDGAQIGAAVVRSGNGGNVDIVADTVEIIGFSQGLASGIFVNPQPGSIGNGGNLTIEAGLLRIAEGGVVTASTLGNGNAGDITLQANEIDISGVSESNQFASRITAFSATDFSAGSVNIITDNLTIRDGATISVSSLGDVGAGNLTVDAQTVILDNQGSLEAQIVAGNQGNIELTTDLLILRNNSNITTNAGEQANGGNITIESINLVALEDSNITANARSGQGGNITITAQGFFLSGDSNITASSEFGIDGVVILNTPDNQQKAITLELPTDTIDGSQQIVRGCQENGTSRLIVSGRGGLPTHLNNSLGSDGILVDLGNSATVQENGTPNLSMQVSSLLDSSETIIEANSWRINEEGNVELIAMFANSGVQTPNFNCGK